MKVSELEEKLWELTKKLNDELRLQRKLCWKIDHPTLWDDTEELKKKEREIAKKIWDAVKKEIGGGWVDGEFRVQTEEGECAIYHDFKAGRLVATKLFLEPWQYED